ncbi:Asp23/Gls24 family envelope stress response protein [Streptomyces sp. NBC_01571]|uniref:Asp23/Gls24 family envelope stress response protein n=1 Tax=Streptomyces sp. NBC_01571 TaxID=2975883 RepID=UPI0022550B19|nr:Asp23/Gls24 family envelope stress response protein [Streptomyces sp. NBC_01571]MCX4578479.1 Asp23/Gls24 family envelope stress response protein [Streptomyces sp. NBC_01571]
MPSHRRPPDGSRRPEEAGGTGPAAGHHVACPCCRDTFEDPALDTATEALQNREPPSTQCLVARVMTIVHDQMWPGPTLPLDDPTRTLHIVERAASAVLRRAADEVPGVTAVSCRLARSDHLTGVRVSMTLTAGMNRPLPETAGLVRRSVVDISGHDLGLAVTAVDITVIEAHHTSG